MARNSLPKEKSPIVVEDEVFEPQIWRVPAKVVRLLIEQLSWEDSKQEDPLRRRRSFHKGYLGHRRERRG